MARKWIFHPHDESAISRLAAAMRVTPLVAQVLIARGCHDPETATSYLNPKLSNLHDPNLLPGVNEAADRVVSATQSGRRITIYGDYDVDGVTATSILWHCLKLSGAKVDYHIPCRVQEGYGLNADTLRQLHEDDPKRLIVSVDCGISNVKEAAVAKELGLELIITDHHHIGDELPDAAALVHPRLPGSEYPFGELCGAGVAFKLAWAICQRLGDGKRASPRMREFLKSAVGLAAIGTVADVVPLIDENRILVRYGLQTLRENPTPGLAALLRVCELLKRDKLTAEDIGFGIGPRINAAGRLGQARLAVEMLTTENADRAIQLATYVDGLNKNRKTVERRIVKQAKEMVADNPEWLDHPTLVLANHDWHQGVIGIVASRIAEAFEKPAVMIALKEDGIGSGSARAYAGFDMHSGLASCAEILESFGGHKAAAGLRVRPDRIDELRTGLANWATQNFHPTDEDLALRVDAEVHLSEVTRRAVLELQHLGPFGAANPRPRFAAANVELAEPPRTMGEGDRHLAIKVRQHKTSLRAVAFGRGEWAPELAENQDGLAISFVPQINDFRGYERVELQLHDWKSAAEHQQEGKIVQASLTASDDNSSAA